MCKCNDNEQGTTMNMAPATTVVTTILRLAALGLAALAAGAIIDALLQLVPA